ncbi:hypothetical protein Pint_25805 [Pistacia integerrima]|uniref:Uncharacterized protein n=1 Tax=Pistacia integerrima TaxID=434235 RepID=A0ACC0YFY5_9ROSI|nr:hypothetical protein Pint_25805 [Pistacia integerrima]
MQPQFPLHILSKKFIKPASPTPYNLRKLKISSLDQCQLPIYVPYLFCYPLNDKTKNSERSKLLQTSLSQILTLFYPLAGRYIEDKLIIDCNDHGVEYIEVEVACHLAPFLRRDLDGKNLQQFFPHQSESPSSPLVAVQWNMFECGGVAIGLCILHRIVDGFVYSKFVDAWSTSCRLGFDKVVHHQPSFDLGQISPTREVMPKVTPISQPHPEKKVASATFVFSNLAISNLRMLAKGAGQFSRVQLVTALIWKALIRVAEAKHGQLRPSIITHLINMRGRTSTSLPISKDSCGNIMRPVLVRFTPEKMGNKVEFDELVSLVCGAITNCVKDCAKPQNGEDLFLMVDSAWKKAAEESKRNEVVSYFFTSACGMPIYPDFGLGKPVRVTRKEAFAEEIISLMDTRDGDGIEAWISLEENDMKIFQQDPCIIAFTSQKDQHDDDRSIYLRSRC